MSANWFAVFLTVDGNKQVERAKVVGPFDSEDTAREYGNSIDTSLDDDWFVTKAVEPAKCECGSYNCPH